MNPRIMLIALGIVLAVGVAYVSLMTGTDKAPEVAVAPATSQSATAPTPADGKSDAAASKEPAPFDYDHFRVGNRNIKAMFADGGIVWIGTSGGVVRYDIAADDFEMFDNTNGLLSNGVFHLSKVDNELWVGTYGGGMSVLNLETDTWRNYNVPSGMGDAFVYGAAKMSWGDVWIATWSGANLIRGGALDDFKSWETFTVENTNGGLPNDWVYGLAEGKNGEVWFATEGGLARYKDKVWTNWSHKDGLGAKYETVRANIVDKTDPGTKSSHHAIQKKEMGLENVDIAYNPNYVIALQVAQDGKVWAGTWGGGLSIFDGTNWKTYTTSDGLPANHVFMLREDKKGNMWIGTNKGLARYDNGSFVRYGKADGLYSDNVFSMAFAEDGTVWVGSFGGAARFYNGLNMAPTAN